MENRAVLVLSAAVTSVVLAATAQFEVASVKPCKQVAGRMMGAGEVSPGRLRTGCSYLVDGNSLGLIQRAYVRFAGGRPNPFGVVPVVGGPAWIRKEMFEIEAKADGAATREMMQGPMLQKLLEERFRLKVRRMSREGRVYDLIAAIGGPKLKTFQEGSCAQMPLTFPMPEPAPGHRYCRAMVGLLKPGVHAEGSTLGEFSKLLNLVLDRPVVDKTGIAGRFDLQLEFAPDQATPGVRPPVPEEPVGAGEPGGPSIFTAIQEQLGLRLIPGKGPVDVLVVERVERPSGN